MDQWTTTPGRISPPPTTARLLRQTASAVGARDRGASPLYNYRCGARGRSSLRCRTTMDAATAPSATDQLRAEFLHVLRSRRLNPDGKCVFFFSPQGFSYLTPLISVEFVPWFDCRETCTQYCKIFGLAISLPFCRIISVQFHLPLSLGDR